jgi:muramoyltetrapeptide carboxypeptidase
MITRGGYGLTRLLSRIDWPLMARSVERGTRWVGYSDFTALQMGLLAQRGGISWHGPSAIDDFSRTDEAGGVEEITHDCFCEAMNGELEALGFRTEAGFDGLAVRGVLWGGNLCVLTSLLGTPHWPRIKGGVLFLEDVNEHPYRIERMLLQLHEAGVLAQQKAVVLGGFTAWKPTPLDRGYSMKTVLALVRSLTATPVITGMPFGHVPVKVTFPMGARVRLLVDGRDVLIGW